MRKRHQMKGLCLFLCLCMLLPCMAATVFASDATEETSRSAATIPEGSINAPGNGYQDQGFELPKGVDTVWAKDYTTATSASDETQTYQSYSATVSTSGATLIEGFGLKTTEDTTPNMSISVTESTPASSFFQKYDDSCLLITATVNFESFPEIVSSSYTHPLSLITWTHKETSTKYLRFVCIDEEGYLYDNNRVKVSESAKLTKGEDAEISIVMDMDPTKGSCAYAVYVNGAYSFSGEDDSIATGTLSSSSLRIFDTQRTYSAWLKSFSVQTVASDYKLGVIPTADWAAYQTTKATENDEGREVFDVRLISLLNSLEHAAAGYEIVASYQDTDGEVHVKQYDKTTDTVYTSLQQTVNGEVKEWTASDNGGKYILALAVNGIYADLSRLELMVRPYTLGSDGNKAYGTASYLMYNGIDDDGYPTFTSSAATNSGEKVTVTEDTYVRFGANANNSYGTESTVQLKNNDKGQYTHANTRCGFLKFDLTGLPEDAGVYELNLNFSGGPGEGTVKLTAIDPDCWEESTLTGASAKSGGTMSTSGWSTTVTYNGKMFADVTEYVKEALEDGKTEISFRVEYVEYYESYASFYSRESGGQAACIVADRSLFNYEVNLDTAVNRGYDVWNYAELLVDDWNQNIWTIYGQSYSDTTVEASKSAADYTTPVKITGSNADWSSAEELLLRTVGSVSGYTALGDDATVVLDAYGGLASDGGKYYDDPAYSKLVNGTKGYFGTYYDSANDRWWYITPAGNRFISIGMCTVNAGSTDVQRALAQTVFDGAGKTYNEWVTELFNTYGINTATGSVSAEYDETELAEGVGYNINTHSGVSLISQYGKSLGLNASIGGSTVFKNNNTINVFDPDFVSYAYVRAQTVIGSDASNPNRMGWTSDNEIPADSDMLDRYLSLDPTDPVNAFSYATAWTWLRYVTGKANPSPKDAEGSMTVSMGGTETEIGYRQLFRGFVYYRYYAIASGAIKTAAPNQLYMGCRELANNYQTETVMRVAGYFCDVVTVNLYLGADPDASVIANIHKWGGKPVCVTEFYAKALGSDENGNMEAHQPYSVWSVKYDSLISPSAKTYYTVDRIVTTVSGDTATGTYYAGETALWKIDYSAADAVAGESETQISAYIAKNGTTVTACYLADGTATYRDADGAVKTVPTFILNSTRGAGKVVRTQQDRATYYQAFALKMLEAGYCVGWTWYRYQDNDMTIYWDTTENAYVENTWALQQLANAGTLDTDRYVVVHQGETDQSNLDSNKGIVDNELNVYTELAEGIAEVSKNMYALADFFDANRR